MFSVEPYRTEPGIWQTSHPATMAEPRKQGASGERPIARVLDERSCHSGAKPRPWPPVSVQSGKTSTEARPQLHIAHIVPGATLPVLPDDAVLAAAYFDITLCVWSTLPNHGIFCDLGLKQIRRTSLRAYDSHVESRQVAPISIDPIC